MFKYIFKRIILMVLSIIVVLDFTYIILSFSMYVKWTNLSNQQIWARVWYRVQDLFLEYC